MAKRFSLFRSEQPKRQSQRFNRSLTRTLTGAIAVIVTMCSLANHAHADDDRFDEMRDYLATESQTSYLQQGDHDLQLVESPRRALANTTVYQKTIEGIPLHGGFVRITKNANGTVTKVSDYSSERLTLNLGQLKIGSKEAEAMVGNNLPRSRAMGSSSQLVWFRTGDSAKLAWEVTTDLDDSVDVAAPTGLITVLDAETGDVLSQSQTDSKTYVLDGLGTVHGVFPRIVINNSIGAAGSRTYAAPFEAVAMFDFGCTGTLIADDVFLSARHCGVQAGDQVIFGANSNNGTFTATVQSSTLPDGNGSLLDGGDVVIVKLAQSVPANIATPMRLIDETNSLEGEVCATVGYGYNGLGSQGHNFTADGRRWGGENIIDRYGSPADAGGSNIFSTDFDNGSGSANTIPGSSSTPLQFEATTAPGDSGGPILVRANNEWVIAGVLSGGTTNDSTYGDISWWTGTAEYKSQIEAQGGQFIDDTPSVVLGDINLDGIINLLDVAPFVERVSSGQFQAEADTNGDGAINLLDVSGFIDLLNG